METPPDQRDQIIIEADTSLGLCIMDKKDYIQGVNQETPDAYAMLDSLLPKKGIIFPSPEYPLYFQGGFGKKYPYEIYP